MCVNDAEENLTSSNNKMRIFILEDDHMRIHWFTEKFKMHKLTIATNAADAIKILSSHEFSFIMLDHDLGGKVFVDSEDENTGYQVAKALITTANAKKPVIIHSWNVPAAKRMQYVIGETSLTFPFGSFDKSILEKALGILRARKVIK